MMRPAFPQLFNQSQQDNSRILVSFKAGLMNVEPLANNKFWITPDVTKGQIEISREHAGLFVLYWKNRVNNTIEKTIHLVPGVATLKKIDTGREKDRVYLFQFLNSTNYVFFWMQDKNDSKDQEHFRKINDVLRFDDTQPTNGALEDPLTAAIRNTQRSFVQQTTTQQNLGSRSAQIEEILQSLGQPGPLSTNNSSQTNENDTTQQQLQNIMQGIASAFTPQSRVSLSQVLNPDALIQRGVLDDPEIQARLLPLLPEEKQTPQELLEAIRSPQFQQSVAALERTVETNSFGSMMASFGLDPSISIESLCSGDAIGAFLEALLRQVQQRQNNQNQKENESENDKKIEEN